MKSASPPYEALLERGRAIYSGTRIGRPGRGWAYWPLYVPTQVLRARRAVEVSGDEHVAPGPAILVGNHLSLLDPVLVGITHRWRLTFFTKVEVYEQPGAVFFRVTGQIPLRRGDEESTQGALDVAQQALGFGNKLAVYPEGTRSPDGRSLHRLHRRVLVPVLQANPGVPVHAMTIAYPETPGWRERAELRFSPALDLDVASMSANELTDRVTTALRDLGGMPYVHAFGRERKSEA